MRSDVTFASGGLECAGWLYRPDTKGRLPLVVMAHGFSATRELRLDAYAERFCAAGLAALAFDYRHFGASAGEPRQLLDIAKQHDDYRAAVDYARALDWVDPDRVALFGTSFSGGHVLVIAARDRRIAALVSQCPFTDGLASLPRMGVANIARATVAGLADQIAGSLGGRPRYIPAVGPPGSFAVMPTPDSEPGFQALLPADTRWENRVAARVALRVAGYRPGRSLSGRPFRHLPRRAVGARRRRPDRVSRASPRRRSPTRRDRRRRGAILTRDLRCLGGRLGDDAAASVAPPDD